jgi:beta-lactam-binding protein with PASTA domain
MIMRDENDRAKLAAGTEQKSEDSPNRPPFKRLEEFARVHGKPFFVVSLGFLIFSVLLSTAVFFLAVRGSEQVLVPDVTGRDLTAALLDLQVKELYPQIQLRYSDSAVEKNMILEQNPQAGTIVKAGRRIRLVISQGARLSTVENFVGRTLSDVSTEIAQIAASGPVALITLKEPFLYKTSDAPVGTILEQNPVAGTAVTGPVEVTLVVSRGTDNGEKEMPAVIGLSPSEAAARFSEYEINFAFTTAQAGEGEKPFVVKAQDWPAGARLTSGRTVTVQVTMPASWPTDEICALYTHEIPRTPVPIVYTLTAISPQGERTNLITEILSSGAFTYPYQLPEGTTLSLSVQGRELHREVVRMQ